MKTRFSYHPDPFERGRVVTVARAIEDDKVHYAYAVCRPSSEATHYFGKNYLVLHVPGDEFSKKVGRDISSGRLTVKPTTVTRTSMDEHPLDAIRRHIVERAQAGEHIPSYVQRTLHRPERDQSSFVIQERAAS